ncbi:cdc42 effector protein 3 [Denticeps clupeoides]|uniref:CRIB domain-containing protein n=1 Tax=Denticeps clupeoides TaxID=299321 RepID=A0AAY4CJ99_9TELE|nr:cdc42 effector protein 3-like [Denticeps clupeoides]XP_028850109.1 cdc42 effector protein 3-like [Denticeps clupeoides]
MPLKTMFYRKPSSACRPMGQLRRRNVPSVHMISLPLGDFRHVSHIGSDPHKGNFGDLSFLKRGHSLLLQSSQSEQNLFLACSPPPKPPRLNLEQPEALSRSRWENEHRPSKERRKKCSSLPLLDCEEEEERDEERSGQSGSEQASMSFSPDGGSLSSGRDSTQTTSEEPHSDEGESGFFFNLDLGPSILHDVLQVMENCHR